MPPDLPYDPVPDLAALLRVLHWAAPIGPAWPGSAADLAGRLRLGLGLPADAAAAGTRRPAGELRRDLAGTAHGARVMKPPAPGRLPRARAPQPGGTEGRPVCG